MSIEAEALNRERSGGYAIGTSPDGLTSVGYFNNGSHLCYDEVDLTGVRSLELRYAKGDGEQEGRIAVLAVDGSGARINLGEKATTPTGGWETYEIRRMGLSSSIEGVRLLCIVGMAGGGIFNLDKFVLSDRAGEHDGITRSFELAEDTRTAAGHRFRLEKVAEAPGELWSIDFLGPDLIVAAQKNGTLWIYEDGQRLGPIDGTPRVWDRGQGGLHTVKAHPRYVANGWIYLTYADPGANGAMTRIVRGRLNGRAWTDEQTIYRAAPDHYTDVGHHFGSRLIFKDEYLFFSVGDRGQEALAQDLGAPHGKIHRLRDDGTVPSDNPFATNAHAVPSIWSYGHRNPQGAALNPRTGELWVHEHGPRGGDEINIIRRCGNYGWPVATHGRNYSGLAIPEARGAEVEGMIAPHYVWAVSPAISGMAFYDAERFAQWRNSLFVGALKQRELIRLQFEGDRIVAEERLLGELEARIRDVRVGPDGYVYVLTDASNGALLRVSPQ